MSNTFKIQAARIRHDATKPPNKADLAPSVRAKLALLRLDPNIASRLGDDRNSAAKSKVIERRVRRAREAVELKNHVGKLHLP